MKHKFYVLLTLLSFMPLFLHSQQINVSGYVYDFLNKEPLPGVTVQIQGTTRGSITNEKGFFTIGGVSEGEILIFSFMGYIRDEYQASATHSGEITIFLVPDMQMLNEVVITVQAKGQVSALNEQLNSNYISNVISAERLQEIPDATVADALGRIPGVTVRSSAGEGDKIQIRGMEPRFNLVTVNGVRAPSADPNESSVGLAGVSPFMIAGIEVQKSLTPDKDGDVVGGIVDLRLKDADEGFNVNVVLQNNFNSLVNSNINPRTTLQISKRFFNNKLGIIAVGNYESVDRSSQRMSAHARVMSTQNPVRLELENVNFWSSDLNRERYGGSLFMDYRLPAGSIKASTFINGLNNDEFRKQFYKGQGLHSLTRNIESVVTNTLSMVNSFKVEHKLFWNSTIDAGVSYTLADSKTPVNYGLSTLSLSPAGFDPFTLPSNIRRLSENQETIYPYEILAIANFVSDSSYIMSGLSSRDNTFLEDELTSFINWKVPVKIGNHISGEFKMGGKYRKKSREYDASDRGHGLTVGGQELLRDFIMENNPDLDFGTGRFFNYVGSNFTSFYLLSDYDQMILDDQFRHRGFIERGIMEQIIGKLDDDNWSVTQTGKLTRRDIPNDYSGEEETKAGYAMASFDITKYFQIVGGARYEDITTNYRSFGVTESGVFDLTLEEFGDSLAIRNHSFLLPMVNSRVMPFEWLQLRFAYTQSIAHPKYYSYMPRYTLNRLSVIGNIGNPELKPALSHNIDANFSIRVNNPRVFTAGVLTAGVFQKRIEGYEYVKNYINIHDSINNRHPYNVIARNRESAISVPINNPEPSYSRGIEVDWQGSFIYLPRPFNGITFTANYTYTDTEQTQQIQKINKRFPNPATPWIVETTIVDSTFKDVLFSQPKHIFNASLGYDLGGFSARVAYARTAEAFVGYFGTGREHPENRRLSQMQQLWDLSLTQRVPRVEGLQIFLNVSNITSTFNSKEFVNTTGGGDPYPLYEEYFGRLTIIGLRYTM